MATVRDCKHCGKTFSSYEPLRFHNLKRHKIKTDQCYVDHLLSGIWPLCECGCKEKMPYKKGIKNKGNRFDKLLPDHFIKEPVQELIIDVDPSTKIPRKYILDFNRY